ncbi:MAG: chromate resistance protein [Acidobacteriia bacterium]|nr:chromate resistance protein [Terriglobia bacterium]
MSITSSNPNSPWLLLVFSLPAKNASQRVQIWRKLQRYGTLALRSSGHVLPNTAANQEHMEWLAAAIRAARGQASVIKVQDFDDLPAERLTQLFLEARARDYQKLLHEAKKLLAQPAARRPGGQLTRIRRRFVEITAIDFFESPLRGRVEHLLAQADQSDANPPRGKHRRKFSEYLNRVWITRPRPGIDRVSSAWLIRRFIDPKARFVFGNQPGTHPDAIPFDMFSPEGFGHRGEDCTFETLCQQFTIKDRKVRRIAHIIHDADLGDDKFGRVEGQGLDQVLDGWAKQDLPDDELLQRGMELIEGLYSSMK